MPYVRDIAKMPQNIISPQALMTTGTLLAEKEGVSDGHHTKAHRHVTCTLPSVSSPVSVSFPIVSTFPSPGF